MQENFSWRFLLLFLDNVHCFQLKFEKSQIISLCDELRVTHTKSLNASLENGSLIH